MSLWRNRLYDLLAHDLHTGIHKGETEDSVVDFNQFDKDQDDEWDLEEFRMWDDSPSSEEEMRDDFDAEDKDGDGFVSEEEMRMDSKIIGAQEIAELAHVEFLEADSDGDGRVSFGEYAAFFL